MKKYRSIVRLTFVVIGACILTLLACHRRGEGNVSSVGKRPVVETESSTVRKPVEGETSSSLLRTWEKPSSALSGLVQAKVEDFVVAHPSMPRGLTLHIVGREGDSQGWKRFSAAATEMVRQLNKAYELKKETAIQVVIDGSTKRENLENQINVWDSLLVKSPDAMALSAVDMFSMRAQLEAAAESAIPVIGFDSGIVEESYEKSYAGMIETDYHQIGRDLMERLQRAGVTEGKILLLGSSDNTMSVQQMISGLEEYRSENLPKLERPTILYRDRQTDVLRLEDVMQWRSYAAIVGLSQNEVQAGLDLRTKLGKLASPEQQKRTDIETETAKPPIVTGVGYISRWADDMEARELLGVIDINHREVACATVALLLEKAMAALEQKQEDFRQIRIPHAWIDLETMETEVVKTMLE